MLSRLRRTLACWLICKRRGHLYGQGCYTTAVPCVWCGTFCACEACEFAEFDTPTEDMARMLREGEAVELATASTSHTFSGVFTGSPPGVFSIGGVVLDETPRRIP